MQSGSLSELARKANSDLNAILPRYYRALERDVSAEEKRLAVLLRDKAQSSNISSQSTWEQIRGEISSVIEERNKIVDQYLGRDIPRDGTWISETISAGKYLFCRSYVSEKAVFCRVDVAELSGRIEATLSFTNPYVLASNQPDAHNIRIHRTILLEKDRSLWKSGPLYLSVRAISASSISLRVQTVTKQGMKNAMAKVGSQDDPEAPARDRTNKSIMDRVEALKEPAERKKFAKRVADIRRRQVQIELQAVSLSARQDRDFELINQRRELRPPEVRKLTMQRIQLHRQRCTTALSSRNEQLALKNRLTLAKLRTEDEQMQRSLMAAADSLRLKASAKLIRRWIVFIVLPAFAWRFIESLRYKKRRNRLCGQYLQAVLRAKSALKPRLSHFIQADARRHAQTLRSAIVFLAATLSTVKKDRSADLLKKYLEHRQVSNPLPKLLGAFRVKITLIQRRFRERKMIFSSRLLFWGTLWRKNEADNLLPPVKEAIMQKTLLAYLRLRVRGARERYQEYEDAMAR
jgi:hypothetical protein